MTWKDKLELGLKEDAAFRKDNLPPRQVRGPEKPAGPGRSPEIPMARNDENQVPAPETDNPIEEAPSEDADKALAPNDAARHMTSKAVRGVTSAQAPDRPNDPPPKPSDEPEPDGAPGTKNHRE